MKVLTKIISYIALFAGIILGTSFFGGLYVQYVGDPGGGFFWGFANPEYIPGFFMSYIFCMTLFLMFVYPKKYIALGIAVGWVFLLNIDAGMKKDLLVNITVFVFAFIIAHLIILLDKLLKKEMKSRRKKIG